MLDACRCKGAPKCIVFCTLLFVLALLIAGEVLAAAGRRGRDPSEAAPPYIEWLESYSHILYPLMIVGVVALIIGGILASVRTQGMAGLVKAEARRCIIVELRQQMQGTNAEHLAKVVGLEPFRVVALLEEMQRDGLVTSYTSSDRRTTWQVKGAFSQRTS